MASQALMKAVTSARLTQTRLMLQMGADVNIRDAEGQTPIIRALCLPRMNVRPRLLKRLLKAGAVISRCDKKKNNALMWACRVGSLEDVSLLLQHADVDLYINAQNSKGQTALWTAVEENRVEIVQELLRVLSKQELNFEVEDHAGVTPAQLAAQLGHLDCLRVMVSHLNSLDRSVRALVNMTKMNAILKTMGRMNGPQRDTETPNPECFQPVHDTPTIQVTSAEGRPILSQTSRPRRSVLSPILSEHHPTSSLSIYSGLSRSASPDPFRARMTTTEQQQHDHHEKASRRLPRLTAALLGEDRARTFLLPDRGHASSPLSRSSSDLTALLYGGPEGPEVMVWPQLVRRTPRDRASVRDSLPRLFEIHAHQMSESFRKTAVLIPPPSPKAENPQPQGPSWSKLKNVALVTNLRKSGNLTGIAAAAAAAVAAGISDGGTSAPESNASPTKSLAGLFRAKRRLTAGIKQHSG